MGVLGRSHLLQDNVGQNTGEQVLLLLRAKLLVGWSVEKWRLEKTGLRWSSSFIIQRMLVRSSDCLWAPNSSSNVEDRARYKILSAGSSEKDN